MGDTESEVLEVVIVDSADMPSDTVGGVVTTIDATDGVDVVDRESVGRNDEDDEEEADDDMGGEDKDDPETIGGEN